MIGMNRERSYFYEVLKEELLELEEIHGLPDSVVTRDWDSVTTSVDNLYVIIESSKPLDEIILGATAMTEKQAVVRVNHPDYKTEED